MFCLAFSFNAAGRLADMHKEGAYRVDALTGEKNFVDGGGNYLKNPNFFSLICAFLFLHFPSFNNIILFSSMNIKSTKPKRI